MISTGAAQMSDDLTTIRQKAIAGLQRLFDTASLASEKAQLISALRQATRLPSQAAYSNELCELVLKNSKEIADFLTARAPSLPPDLIEHLENRMFREYQRACEIAADEHDRRGCKRAAENLIASILRFRDLVNADPQYVQYKTLVGYEAVFDYHWNGRQPGYNEGENYRKEKIEEYIREIDKQTIESWYVLTLLCAGTKSNDGATFPIFLEFLRRLGQARPHIAIEFLRRENPDLMDFLAALLTGLSESDARADYQRIVSDYLARNAYLTNVARHCRAAALPVDATVREVLTRAIAPNETFAVFECLIFAIEKHSPELPLIGPIFVPAIQFLNGRGDARWIHGAWYLR
jgi:hypothetical protein